MLENRSLLLNNSEELILSEFKTCFAYVDSVRTPINKIWRLCQRDRPTLTYVVDFHLLATNILLDNHALIEQSWFGLSNDVKYLLFTFQVGPKSLTEATNQAIRCDNRRLERGLEQDRSSCTCIHRSKTIPKGIC